MSDDDWGNITFTTARPRMTDQDALILISKAFHAGYAAAKDVPPPESVKIGERHGKPIWGANMFKRRGQAWVSFPNNSPFAQYARRAGYGSNVPAGGYGIYIHQYGQDAEYKRAFVKAFVQVLNDAGVKAYAHVMMDN